MSGNEIVQVDLIFRSASGQSILDKAPGDNQDLKKRFAATEETQEQALRGLREHGFRIIIATSFGASIAGPRKLVREVFGEGDLAVPASLEPWIEAVHIPPRGEFPSLPPAKTE